MDACSAVSIETPVTQRTCPGVAPVYKSMGLHREQDHIFFLALFRIKVSLSHTFPSTAAGLQFSRFQEQTRRKARQHLVCSVVFEQNTTVGTHHAACFFGLFLEAEETHTS
jgi:hypothetical protein